MRVVQGVGGAAVFIHVRVIRHGTLTRIPYVRNLPPNVCLIYLDLPRMPAAALVSILKVLSRA